MIAYEPEGKLACETAIVRTFLGIAEDEPIELTGFSGAKPWVHQCTGLEAHVRALETVERSVPRFSGAYMLVNGPINPAICARYAQGRWVPATNGRANDRDIGTRRAIFIDIDPIRPKGISATDDERQAAWEVAQQVREQLESSFGRGPVGFGGSGNGWFLLLAIEPVPVVAAQAPAISRLLKALGRKYGTDRVSIDDTVINAARLMCAPGTMKRKGENTLDRPHRETSFCASLNMSRVPLSEVTG